MFAKSAQSGHDAPAGVPAKWRIQALCDPYGRSVGARSTLRSGVDVAGDR